MEGENLRQSKKNAVFVNMDNFFKIYTGYQQHWWGRVGLEQVQQGLYWKDHKGEEVRYKKGRKV